MATPETLSVRLSREARAALDEAAAEGEVAGASALAREILEQWAEARRSAKIRSGVQRAVSYLIAHPSGWSDEPAEFFPGASEPA